MLRFWSKATEGPGCMEWTGYVTNKGYGKFRLNRKSEAAHKVAFELVYGSIPAGLEIDHKCRNRRCVNPTHLEAVTHAENVRRATEARTHCPGGHPFSGKEMRKDGKFIARYCAVCKRQASARYYAKKTAHAVK